jgi:hypothetical protein
MAALNAFPLHTIMLSSLTLDLDPFRHEFHAFHLHTIRPLNVVNLDADHCQVPLALQSVQVRPRDLRQVLGEN